MSRKAGEISREFVKFFTNRLIHTTNRPASKLPPLRPFAATLICSAGSSEYDEPRFQAFRFLHVIIGIGSTRNRVDASDPRRRYGSVSVVCRNSSVSDCRYYQQDVGLRCGSRGLGATGFYPCLAIGATLPADGEIYDLAFSYHSKFSV